MDFPPSSSMEELMFLVLDASKNAYFAPADVPEWVIERAVAAVHANNSDSNCALQLLNGMLMSHIRHGDHRAALILKPICEEAHPDLAEHAGILLQGLFQMDLLDRASPHGVSWDDFKRSPGDIITSLYFTNEEARQSDADPQVMLIGALLLSSVKRLYDQANPTGHESVVCALTETQGYLLALEEEAAITAIQWIDSRLRALLSRGDVDEQLRSLLADTYVCLYETAKDNGAGKFMQTHLPLASSLPFLSAESRVKAHYWQSEEFYHAGKLEQSMRHCELATSGLSLVTDDLKLLVEMRRRTLQLELTGSIDQFSVSDGVHNDPLVPVMQGINNVLRAVASGEEPQQAELRSAVTAIWTYLQHKDAETDEDVLQKYVLLLKFWTKLDAPVTGIEIESVIAQGAAHQVDPKSSQAVQFAILAKHICSKVGSDSDSGSDPLENIMQLAIAFVEGGDEARSCITYLSESREAEELHDCSSLFAAHGVDAMSAIRVRQLEYAIPNVMQRSNRLVLALINLVSEMMLSARRQARTTTMLNIVRSEFRLCISGLVGEVFWKLLADNCVTRLVEHDELFLEARIDKVDPDCWHMAERLCDLLHSAGSWMLNRNQQATFRKGACFLSTSEMREYRDLTSDIAVMFSESYSDPFSYKKLDGRRGRLHSQLERLSVLLGMVQAAAFRETGACTADQWSEEASLTSHGELFLCEVFPLKANRLLSCILRTDGRISMWASKSGTQALMRFNTCNVSVGNDVLQLRSELEHLSNCRWNRDDRFSGLSGGQSHMRFCNLTSIDVPFQVAFDASLSIPVINGFRRVGHTLAEFPRISFWGGFPLGATNSYCTDETSRRIVDDEGVVLLRFPEMAMHGPLPQGNPRPLLYSQYEKWHLMDLAQSGSCSCAVHASSDATRSEFIGHDWSQVSILHISTHGHVYDVRRQLADFCLCNNGDSIDRVTYFDVLSMNWSSIEVVFLNCCVSDRGKATHGEERLSMAWAFLAGGARAVIAHRWYIPDMAAMHFSRCFYDALLSGDSKKSVPHAFVEALRELKMDDRFSDPCIWGSFVLLG